MEGRLKQINESQMEIANKKRAVKDRNKRNERKEKTAKKNKN
jgi:hypothetical protein